MREGGPQKDVLGKAGEDVGGRAAAWIKVEDAHNRRPMWVNLDLATAVREERDLVRISFDKDNVVSTREGIATFEKFLGASNLEGPVG